MISCSLLSVTRALRWDTSRHTEPDHLLQSGRPDTLASACDNKQNVVTCVSRAHIYVGGECRSRDGEWMAVPQLRLGSDYPGSEDVRNGTGGSQISKVGSRLDTRWTAAGIADCLAYNTSSVLAKQAPRDVPLFFYEASRPG